MRPKPDEYEKAALEFCNGIRTRKGMGPLEELPRGVQYDDTSCPCAKASGIGVGITKWWEVGHNDQKKPLPLLVYQFVSRFDAGLYPHLVQR